MRAHGPVVSHGVSAQLAYETNRTIGDQVTRIIARPAALITLLLSTAGTAAAAQEDYHDHDRLSAALREIARSSDGLAELQTIATSPGGRDVLALRIGSGDRLDERPALLIFANAYGPHLVGSEVALRLARRFVAAADTAGAVASALARHVVYVIPRLNPDAAEAFFDSPRVERVRNDRPSDDDGDWEVDEDGFEDLDGDGVIGQMRVYDPAGDWAADSTESALHYEVDRSRGERGAFRILTEGVDDDGDEEWNEDPRGGTDVNANFSYEYEFFRPTGGVHQMSAPEARGLAEFVVDHPNIAAVYVLGPQDNLMTPWEHRPGSGIAGNPQGTSQGGPLESVLEEDEPYFAEMARRFERLTGAAGTPDAVDEGGDPLRWAYYHMGRPAFGSRVWWIPDVKAEDAEDADKAADKAADEAEPADADEAEPAEAKPEEDRLADERNDLRWLRRNHPDAVIPWTVVDHPDFPDTRVEVGGIAPFARLNPPASMLDSLGDAQWMFVAMLLDALPRIELGEVEVTRLGRRTFRVTARIFNDGYLPTVQAIGDRVGWPRKLRVELVTNGQEIVGGRPIQLVGAVEGNGGSRELSWVVVGDDGSSVSLRVASPVAGDLDRTVVLRGGGR